MKISIQNRENQPVKWMPCPKIDIEYPGLAYISTLDELIVVKCNDSLHNVIGKTGVGYTIYNKAGEKVFLAVKRKRCCKFDLKIFNYYGNEVIQVRRPFELCFKRLQIWAPPGNYAGSVEQVKCRKIFHVRNKLGEIVLKIKSEGPFQFLYYVYGDQGVGKNGTEWGIAKILGVNRCGLTFPVDISVEDKAVLLGTCFLIGCLKNIILK